MTVDEAMAELQALADERVRKRYVKTGAGKHVFGVKLGELRKLAKRIKQDHRLAMALWKTKNVDARLLAILVLDVKTLTSKQLDRMVRAAKFSQVADWLAAYVTKQHADKESLREQWMQVEHPMAARAGWSLTARRVEDDAKGLDLVALLDRIEADMGDAPEATQWTMNMCLAQIGIHHRKHRKRALRIGEALGVYRDYPTSKGCTSPFAPSWIGEMVRRQG
ncbi:MAG: DNA alkylation repair protein [Nannocystaceae bacterium]|nr:DNA alkylation repair protein [Nannocystaceae bacterium]